MPANLTTLAHFSVSSMISFSKSAGEPDNAEPPIVGSASAVLISFRLTKENPQGRGRSLVLLCHKFRYLFRAAQHGQRDSIVARAATKLRRIVAIEFGTWRSGRNGGSSGLVTFA